MTTVTTSHDRGAPGGSVPNVIIRRSSHRDTLEAIGLLLGMLVILLALALTVGATLPIGP